MDLKEEAFWDRHYEQELTNFNDAGDEGEVWFGKGLSRKIANHILGILKSNPVDGPVNILDIGCGNAFLLSTIAQKVESDLDGEVKGKLSCLGVDFSHNSIELSKKILLTKNFGVKIGLAQCDFLDLNQLRDTTNESKYDIIVDVGTYDAICLLASDSPNKLEETQKKYMNSVYSLVKEGTIFIFASCNHFKDELLSLLNLELPERREMTVIDEIETPKLQYGGQEGSQVCCLIVKFF